MVEMLGWEVNWSIVGVTIIATQKKKKKSETDALFNHVAIE